MIKTNSLVGPCTPQIICVAGKEDTVENVLTFKDHIKDTAFYCRFEGMIFDLSEAIKRWGIKINLCVFFSSLWSCISYSSKIITL